MDDMKFLDDLVDKLERGHEIDTHEIVKVLRMARERNHEENHRVATLDEINRDCYRRIASYAHAWEMLKVITLYADDTEALKQVYDLLKMRLGIP